MTKQSSTRLHKFLPHHALSQLVGWLSDRRWKSCKNRLVAWFIKHYGVNMTEALEPDYTQYPTFNDFFTRRLKPDARPIDTNTQAIISPVDGCISELGSLVDGKLLQAKGKLYSATSLLGGDSTHASLFEKGSFLTAYLAPKDYHRIHMPMDGRLLEMIHVPGRLFSVNPASVSQIDQLFARNERVGCLFETSIGPMAMVMVGAMLVGSVVTAWHGQVTPPTQNTVRRFSYREKSITLAKGDEVGYFKMGSTVILLFPENSIAWEKSLSRNDAIKLGRAIATQAVF